MGVFENITRLEILRPMHVSQTKRFCKIDSFLTTPLRIKNRKTTADCFNWKPRSRSIRVLHTLSPPTSTRSDRHTEQFPQIFIPRPENTTILKTPASFRDSGDRDRLLRGENSTTYNKARIGVADGGVMCYELFSGRGLNKFVSSNFTLNHFITCVSVVYEDFHELLRIFF